MFERKKVINRYELFNLLDGAEGLHKLRARIDCLYHVYESRYESKDDVLTLDILMGGIVGKLAFDGPYEETGRGYIYRRKDGTYMSTSEAAKVILSRSNDKEMLRKIRRQLMDKETEFYQIIDKSWTADKDGGWNNFWDDDNAFHRYQSFQRVVNGRGRFKENEATLHFFKKGNGKVFWSEV